MARKLKLAVAQARTLDDTPQTLQSLEQTARHAVRRGADLILFPEAYLGGYPRSCSFGAAIGTRDPKGREQFLRYFQSAIDLGDTPEGAGDDWVDRKLPTARGEEVRGDGCREELESIAKQLNIFIVTGVIEKSGGSLYCAVVYVDPKFGIIGKRRKVMPTGTERLIWAQGSPKTLRAVTTRIKGVKLTLAAAICWENFMPLLRQSLYSQNVNLYLAPTADPRDTWLPLMRTVAAEGRTFVLSANQCVQRKHLPSWIRRSQPEHQVSHSPKLPKVPEDTGGRRRSVVKETEGGHEVCWPCRDKIEGQAQVGKHADPIPEMDQVDPEDLPAEKQQRRPSTVSQTADKHQILWPNNTLSRAVSAPASGRPVFAAGNEDEFLSRGGSCIISPMGEVLAGPLWETENEAELLVAEVDFDDCDRGRLDMDVAGHYSRNDAFKLTVEGLDLTPPP